MIDLRLQRPALYALAAAALFGASTPFAKHLLDSLSSLQLAGLLYLGSGIGLTALWSGLRLARVRRETALTGRDLPWLAGATLAGGVAAPWLLLEGLRGMPAAGASLLLNLEGVLTALLALVVFREAIGARVWAGCGLMLAGALVLGGTPGAVLGLSPAALLVLAACALWALDNTLTRQISAADPVVIAGTKGWVAGSVSMALASAGGAGLPPLPAASGALVVGAFGYGASLVLYVLALRHLGAARAAAHFGTAPFIGALLAVPLLGEAFDARLGAGFALMLAASWAVLGERHAHTHVHEAMEHSHRHVHDAHHQHAHRGDEGPEPHAHPHRHAPLTHTHAHLPDLHHRHRH